MFTVRNVVAVVLLVHGAIHPLGAVKGLGWAQVTALRQPVSALGGVGWLAAGLLCGAAALMVALGAPRWSWAVALAGAVLSQLMIAGSWSDAKTGTWGNLALLLVAAYGFASLGPTSMSAEWDSRARTALGRATETTAVVSEADLAELPAPVAAYVRRSGALGKPRVTGFSATIHGRIRSAPDSPWMSFTGKQLDVFGPEPVRLFWMDATKAGIPVTVFHVYDDGSATMRGKLLATVPILDASGPKMDQGETVTLLNDLVVFAPAALVDARVTWEPVGPDRVRATYTVGMQSVTAELVFDEEGDLVDFVSDDRSRASGDGSSFTPLRWSTPLSERRVVAGRRTAVAGEGVWWAPEPEGTFSYIEFFVDDLKWLPESRLRALDVDPAGHEQHRADDEHGEHGDREEHIMGGGGERLADELPHRRRRP